MSKTIAFVAFALVSSCLTSHVFPQSLGSNTDGKPGLTLALDLGAPLWFPDDNSNSLEMGRAFRLTAMYGGKLSAGLSFDFSAIDGQEMVNTDESGPNPIGSFTPQVKNQFYAVALRYKPFSTSLSAARFSPFAGVRMGWLRREYDLGLDAFEDFSDEDRFAYAIDVGAEFYVHPRAGLLLSGSYFRTSRTEPDSDFGGSFDTAGKYGAINIGAFYRL